MGTNRMVYKDALINGVTNAVFNGYIAWLILKDRTILEMWGHGGFGFDILATAFLLLFIVALIVIPLSRRKVLGGNFSSIRWQDINPLWSFLRKMPRGLFLRALIFGLIGLLIIAPVTLTFLWLLRISSLTPMEFALIKGIWAGIIAGIMVIPMIFLAALEQ